MAGIYNDIPGTRFALDKDGTVAKVRATSQSWFDVTGQLSNVVTTDPATYMDLTNTQSNDWELALAFPEPRSINGLFIEYGVSGMDGGVISGFQYSTDTTDGTDGTWTAATISGTLKSFGGTMRPYYRTQIGGYSLSNVRGLRFIKTVGDATSSNWRIFALHLYGTRPTSGVDRVAFWHPTSDVALGAAHLDFGDLSQGTVVTKQLRIKNLSASMTANNVGIQTSDLSNDFGGNVHLSTDNSIYSASVSVGTLAPGAISSIVYVRRTVPAAETTTQRAMRLLAEAATWT